MKRLVLLPLIIVLLTVPTTAQVTITLTPAQQDALRAILTLLVGPTPTPPGPSITVPVGGDAQKALDTVADGGTVYLAQGATYTTNLVFKKRTGSVTLRTAGLDDTVIPPGMRVGPDRTPAIVAKMAKIVCADCFAQTIGFGFGAHDASVIGVEVIGNPIHPDRITVGVGFDTNWNNAQTLADLPQNITFDRVYIHADNGGHQGIRMDGRNVNLLESDVRGFMEQGRDSQAVGIVNGAGPFLIRNNYLEGSGENFLIGGSDPSIPNLIPSDITFIGNYVFKPLAWKSKPGSVKNLFELKNAQRVKVDGNVFENNWVDAQPGSAILFTVRNQDGGCPWCVVKDVTFTNNIVKNNMDNFAVSILGRDDTHTSGIASNILIANNLFLNVAKAFQVLLPLKGLELAHNTFVGITGQFLTLDGPVGATLTGLNVHDNVSSLGAYGITGNGTTAVGTPSLALAPGVVFVKNLLEASAERTIPLPDGNYLLPPGQLASKLDAQFRVTDPVYAASNGGLVGVDVSKLPK